MSGKVWLVGAGPGDPGLLTLRAVWALEQAELLLYDELAGGATIAYAPRDCERVYLGKRGGDHAMSQAEIEALMLQFARAGKRVVRLTGGDPFLFGRGGEEAQALHAAGIPFEVVPGISAAIAAPAYAGIPLTHRNVNSAFTIATLHEDPSQPESSIDWPRLAEPHRPLVLLMALGNLAFIAAKLTEHGLDATTPVALITQGTHPTQRTVVATLADIAEECEPAQIGAPAILVVGEVVRLREELRWFDRDPLFGKRLLITRPAEQAHDFARKLYARGIEPLLAPTIFIAPPDDLLSMHRAIDEIASFGWIVFTSRNGVDAFFDRLTELDADARWLGNVRVAAIGGKTAARLTHFGIRPDLVPATAIGEELARTLIERTRERERVLIFRAQEGRDVLPEMLREAGREAVVVAAYQTRFVQDALFAEKVSQAEILTFTSASTVHGFARLLGGSQAAARAARDACVACIGPVTAAAAREHGLHVDVVAEQASAETLLDAIAAHLAIALPT